MAVVLAPVGDARPQFFTDQGAVLNGGLIYFYAAGTATPQNTFTDYTGNTANANPVVLDADGRSANGIWFTQGLVYKIIAKDSAGVTLWTEDQVRGLNDVTATQDEWVATGLTPTYVSATSFTLAGDQTTEFHEGRRLKITAAGATKYDTITGSVFTTLTTVTVAGDALANPTTAVSYSLIRANNPSISSEMVYRKGTAVASAATCDIWNTEGDYLHLTGSTGPITSFGTAPYAGAQKTLIFDSTPTITHHATTLQLPGGLNIFAAAGDRLIVRADTTANMIVTSLVRASGLPPLGTSIPRGHLAGAALSTAGGSATMTVAAGQATDSTNAVVMSLASATGKTTSAWAVGTAAGGLDTGAIATGTWYHFYLIMRPDTGVVDVLFSTSASAPTMPANYSYKRRIGAGLTDGASQWTLFVQFGDTFNWASPPLDINANNPGTNAVNRALSLPLGVNVKAMMNVGLLINAASVGAYISPPDTTDLAASLTAAPLSTMSETVASANGTKYAEVYTDTSRQVRSRITASDASTNLRIATLGWIDRRGRDS